MHEQSFLEEKMFLWLSLKISYCFLNYCLEAGDIFTYYSTDYTFKIECKSSMKTFKKQSNKYQI